MAASPPDRVRSGEYFIGIMSGTSLDGVDAVLADFSAGRPPRALAHADLPMPAALRDTLLALHTPGLDELHSAALAGQALARLYAQACERVLAQSGVSAHEVRAIGAHGQTVRHRPEVGYTLQLNAPALLAELSGIAVVADFRSRDVAAGGQGAPLVPPFHQAMFQHDDATRVVLNLGGIANITILQPGQPPGGFDTGPANMLLDAWCMRHTGAPYDEDGRWAAGGRASQALLDHLLQSEPWFALPPPKSTGRDLFSLSWLAQGLQSAAAQALTPQDVQATLLALTAHTVAQAIRQHAPEAGEVLVCGGGARNGTLMTALRQRLDCPVVPTGERGLPEQWVEAMAFAWLAHAHLHGQPANQPSVTGANGPRILGCLYPA